MIRINWPLSSMGFVTVLLINACSTSEMGGADSSEVMRLASQIEALQDRLDILQSDYNTLKSENQRQDQTIYEQVTEINQLEYDIDDLKSKNQQQLNGLYDIRSEVIILEEVKETLLSKRDDLDEKLKKLQSELTNAIEKIADLQKENEALLAGNLNFTVENAKQNLKVAKERIKQLEALIHELRQKLEENSEVDNIQLDTIRDGWYQATLLQFVHRDERNPDINNTEPFLPTEGVYWHVENNIVTSRGELVSNRDNDTFSVSSEDVIAIEKHVLFNVICHRKNLESPCDKFDNVLMKDAPPIELVDDGIQFSTRETIRYPEGDEVYESTYISHWLGDDLDDLPYQTNYNFTSDKGFNSDPIYSSIERNNPESYLTAFIKDAERHGVDLSFIDVEDFEFDLVPGTDLGFAGIAWNNCNDKVSVGMSLQFWDNARTFDYGNPLISVMWHEFGHTILGLAHTCKISQIMWAYNASVQDYANPSECDSPPYENRIGLIWDHPNPNNNWQRAVKDMFEGHQQIYFTCRNRRGDKKIYCGSHSHH